MDDLKPCPFCGATVRIWYDIELTPVGVICLQCKAAVRFTNIEHKPRDQFGKTIKRITDAWNRREGNGQMR